MPCSCAPLAEPPMASRRPARATAASSADDMAHFRSRVLRLIALIPPGRVATYGQIAALAGYPRRSRHVGNTLRYHDGTGLPWHRVLNAQGRVSPRAGEARQRGDRPVMHRQRRLLEGEGVAFQGDRVNLERYRWRPELEGGALVRGLGARHLP